MNLIWQKLVLGQSTGEDTTPVLDGQMDRQRQTDRHANHSYYIT